MGTITTETTPKTGKLRYVVRYSYVDAMGTRQHRKRRFDKKREATAFLSQVDADLSRSVYFEPSREPVGDYLDRWVSQRPATIRASTIFQERKMIGKRFDAIRSIALADLRAPHINAMVNGWLNGGMARSTANTTLRMLKHALRDAVRWKLLLENPMDQAATIEQPPRRDTVWTPEQVRHFLKVNEEDRFWPAWVVLFHTMIRVGELCALQWDDVDLVNSVITINRTLTVGSNGKLIMSDQGKTHAARRDIPMSPEVFAALDQQWDQQEARRQASDHWEDRGIVFDSGNGRPWHTSSIRYQWRKAIEAAELPVIRLHDARHSAATIAAAAGVPITTLARVMGHRNPALTMQRYIHPDIEDARAATTQLAGIFADSASTKRPSDEDT